MAKAIGLAKKHLFFSQTDLGVSSAKGAGNTQIGFLKARLRRAFKKPIL
jgi:hypothetical protein